MSDISILKRQYEVVDVTKIATPEGMEGKNWHSYTIRRGTTEINGQKPGTLKVVTEHARQVAEDLNTRSSGKSASPYKARNKAN